MPFGKEYIEESLAKYQAFAIQQNATLEARLKARPETVHLGQHIADELAHPGKLLRPALTLASFGVFSNGNPPNRECLAAAHALEVFHTFVLVHDDVIDGSTRRRGRPTIQKRIEESLGIPSENAGHLAIVLGDILFGYAIDLLSSPGVEMSLVGPLQQHLAAVTEETGLGEALELTFLHRDLPSVEEEEIREVYYLKTTRYTIEAPLWLGGLAAGVSAENLAPLKEFARPIGLGFQLENDLHEASLPRSRFGRLAYDFQTGVKTLFLRRLYEDLEISKRSELLETLSQCQGNPQALDHLYDLIHSTKTLDQMRSEVDQCFDQARKWIPQSPYLEREKQGFALLAEFISSKRKHSEAAA
ncbi:MAG: polyprenyl synthetase family protein [Verrucomicrobiota bacterium]